MKWASGILAMFAVALLGQVVFPGVDWDSIAEFAFTIGVLLGFYLVYREVRRIYSKLDRMQKEWEREIQAASGRMERLWD